MKNIFMSLCLWVIPVGLFADCGMTPNMKAHLSFVSPSADAAIDEAATMARTSDWDKANIIGLWHIKFTSGGQLVDEGFDAWHSDGLETLNDTPPPASGNVCLGIYSQTGVRTFKLKHPSWIYDSSNINLIGIATIRETVTLDHSGESFGGTFSIDVVDLSGNPVGHADGIISATRIKVD